MDKLYWLLSCFALTLFFILLRALLGKRMNAGLRYALWGLVLLRLLIPGTVLHSRVSVASAADSVADSEVFRRAELYMTETTVYAGSINKTTMSTEEAIAAHPDGWLHEVNSVNCDVNKTHNYIFHDTLKNQLPKVLIQLWYCGMIVTCIVFLASNLRLFFHLRKTRRPLETELRRNVYVVDSLPSSCLFLGSIYISVETAADETALRCVLAHESAHARHGDDLWALLRCAALVVHWFDPLVWYAAKLSVQDGELFADAGALRGLGGDAVETYGATLIQISAGCPKRTAPLCTATTMCGNKKALRERIRQIAKRPRMGVWAVIVVLLVSMAAVGFAFAGSFQEEKSSNTPDDPEPAWEATPVDLFPYEPGSDDPEHDIFTVSTAWDYDAVMDLYAEALEQELCEIAAQVTPVSVGGLRRMVSFTEEPQKFVFDISMEIVPLESADETLLQSSPELSLREGRYYYETDAVLISWDGLHWSCDAVVGGGVGWRGYRLLYVDPSFVNALIEDVTAAYLRGEISEQCDLLLWCGEFIPWVQLTQNGQLNAVHQALREAAVDETYPTLGPINDDHLYRDLYMLYAASHTDGAFAELFANFIADGETRESLRYSNDCLLGIQYCNDPEAFQYAVSILPEQVRLRLSPFMQRQVTEPSPTPLPEPAVAPTPQPMPTPETAPTPQPMPTPEQEIALEIPPYADYALPGLRFISDSYEDYIDQRRDSGMTILADIELSGCRILSWCYYGTPHGTSASLVVFYPDIAVYLPLPPRSAWQVADPAEGLLVSADGTKLTYHVTFDDTLLDVTGSYIIHRAGTYYYTYDIPSRTISYEIVPN